LHADPTLLRHYGAEAGRHAHEHAQLLFGVDGTLQLEVAGHAAYVDTSCGLVIPAGADHAYYADRPTRVLVLDCPPAAGLDRLRRFALPPGWRQRALDPAALIGLLGSAKALALRRPLSFDALRERIDAEPARAWSVTELAALCHLSPQRLRARFAEALDLSPQAFVRQRRLDRAERLLAQGLALEAVALQVGYASASALSAALRRERGSGARSLRAARASGRASTTGTTSTTSD
jgi:AraC-like DNA-binding protein